MEPTRSSHLDSQGTKLRNRIAAASTPAITFIVQCKSQVGKSAKIEFRWVVRMTEPGQPICLRPHNCVVHPTDPAYPVLAGAAEMTSSCCAQLGIRWAAGSAGGRFELQKRITHSYRFRILTACSHLFGSVWPWPIIVWRHQSCSQHPVRQAPVRGYRVDVCGEIGTGFFRDGATAQKTEQCVPARVSEPAPASVARRTLPGKAA